MPPLEVGMGRLVTDGSDQNIGPLVAGEATPGLNEFIQLGTGNLDGLHPFQNERTGDTTVRDRFVVCQFKIRPHSASKRSFILMRKSFVDMDLVQPRCSELGPVLAALVLLIESHSHHVDQFHRPESLQPRLDQFSLVGADDSLGDHVLDVGQTAFDLTLVGGRAVLAQQVFQDVDRDAETHFQPLHKILPDYSPGKILAELSIQRIDPDGVLAATSH